MHSLVEKLTSDGWQLIDNENNILSKIFEKHFTMIINGQQNVNSQKKEIKIELLEGQLNDNKLYGVSILDEFNNSAYMTYFEETNELIDELNNLCK